MSDMISLAGPHPYPAYKPSGVDWLGDVPAHWKVRRTKTVLKERSQKGFPNEPLLVLYPQVRWQKRASFASHRQRS